MDENSWSRGYYPKRNLFNELTMHDRPYTFLYRSTLNKLRHIGRNLGAKHTGRKNTVMYELLLKAHDVISKGTTDWSSYFDQHYTTFWAAPEHQTIQMFETPSLTCISDHGTGGRAEKV